MSWQVNYGPNANSFRYPFRPLLCASIPKRLTHPRQGSVVTLSNGEIAFKDVCLVYTFVLRPTPLQASITPPPGILDNLPVYGV
jgi:hypothetical protein